MSTPFRVPDDLVAHGLEFIPDGLVAAVGPERTVRFMNSPAERITGLRAGDVVGQDIREALPLQDLAGAYWWELTDPWHGLTTRTGHRERLLVLPSGRELLVTAKYLRDETGSPVRAVVLGLRDAEARRRAEAEGAALLTTVAHELRSPLTGVKGFSSTLLRNWDRFTDDQKRLMLETIEADADRVTRLITELLDASRIDVGRLTVHAQPLDARSRLQAQVERRVASGADRLHFVVDVPDDLGPLWADPDRLEQVVANLVDNAVRHGRGTVRLSAQPARLGDRPAVDLLVADDGHGIAPQHRELVFSRFWQGGAKHGTGLGLYVVRGLVEAHGGVVVVEDAPGGGALLRATFPDRET
ncbi:ATP-binding protein [Fodinibacter luteus]|uniref:histidine kinase n=1 Tax=Fodinibacter luteus TaxID=552064 RepID=A0ABP8KAR8_9MICO